VLSAGSELYLTVAPLLLLVVALGLGVAVIRLAQLSRSLAALARDARDVAQGKPRQRLMLDGDARVADLRLAIAEMAQALGTQVAAAEAEHAQLATILETMVDGVIVLDAGGRVVLINEAAAQLVGARAGAARGRSLVDVARDYELASAVRTALREGTPQRRLIELGHPVRLVQLACTPLIRPASEKQALLLLQDVTELQRADTIRREFVANVSHELRTPVAGLKALAETLASGALEDPPAARSFVDRMELEADRLAQLVEELLELARLEEGRAVGQPELIDLSALVARAAERLRPLADRKGVALHVEASDGLPGVSGDAGRLERAIVNLVDNAIKFTPPDGEVRVRCWRDGSDVLASVSDTGTGIAVQDQARIFERFYKTDRARASGGAGLGLAIAKHSVQGMGGRIWAESEEGKGSTFLIALPAS
jgi:two-component system phosphate regulon sensor histidine kinase PhoR